MEVTITASPPANARRRKFILPSVVNSFLFWMAFFMLALEGEFLDEDRILLRLIRRGLLLLLLLLLSLLLLLLLLDFLVPLVLLL